MHELTIAQELVRTADAVVAAQRRISRITALTCRIGSLLQIDRDLLADAFTVVREGTPCRGARLVVVEDPMRATCRNCRESFAVRGWDWTCPRCGDEGQELTGGDDLQLIGIDTEEDP
jgi:hydrogenase nickel incorporation protein HypA/HybF